MPTAPAPHAPPQLLAPDADGRCVFVVDDDVNVLRAVEALATLVLRWPVRAFNRPEDAVIAARLERPSLLVTDLCMPGMSGLSLTEVLQDFHPQLPVVLITGDISQLEVQRAHSRARIDAVLGKPFGLAEMMRTVQPLILTR